MADAEEQNRPFATSFGSGAAYGGVVLGAWFWKLESVRQSRSAAYFCMVTLISHLHQQLRSEEDDVPPTVLVGEKQCSCQAVCTGQ